MKKKITLILVAIVAVCAMSFKVLLPGGEAGKTGAYSEGDCTQCHADFAVNSGSGSIAITSVPTLAGGYYPDSVYTVTVTVSHSTPRDSLFGFDFEALTNATTNGGTLSLLTLHLMLKIIKASSAMACRMLYKLEQETSHWIHMLFHLNGLLLLPVVALLHFMHQD